MSSQYEIRESTREDVAAILALYPLAFPDEDLVPLVRELLDATSDITSLAGILGSQVAGHVAFTRCGVDGTGTVVSLLAPLAVAPERQRQGIGSELVRAGLRRLEQDVDVVCVLGDPAYYGRLGFRPETRIEPPYPLPAEWQGAWQSQPLGKTASHGIGKLSVPPVWRHRALWAT